MKNKKEIQKIYENYVSQNIILTEEYKKASEEFAIRIEKLEEGLEESVVKELDKICQLMSKMQEEQAKKSFEEGFSLGVNLTLEATKKDNLK